MDENKTVPNFGVNLKPDKFHTVAHFKKKNTHKNQFRSRLLSILCIGKEQNTSPPGFQSQNDSSHPPRNPDAQRVREGGLASCGAWGTQSHFGDMPAPGGTGTCQSAPSPQGAMFVLPHHQEPLSGLSTQPGPCEPEFAACLRTHIFLSFSAFATFFRFGGMPTFFFFLTKRKKKIKSFSVIEIHDKLQFLSSCLRTMCS